MNRIKIFAFVMLLIVVFATMVGCAPEHEVHIDFNEKEIELSCIDRCTVKLKVIINDGELDKVYHYVADVDGYKSTTMITVKDILARKGKAITEKTVIEDVTVMKANNCIFVGLIVFGFLAIIVLAVIIGVNNSCKDSIEPNQDNSDLIKSNRICIVLIAIFAAVITISFVVIL